MLCNVRRRSDSTLQIDLKGINPLPKRAGLDELRTRFKADHAVHLPGFLSPALLARARRYVERARFELTTHADLVPPAVNLTIVDPQLLSLFSFALNDSALTDFVREITECDPIGSWIGDFYRMDPGAGHRDTWHDDMDGNRMVAITINLSAGAFHGGNLWMREKATKRVLWTFHNGGDGDAVLFRLDERLEHWIEEVSGTTPKSAVAGWFQRRPAFWRELVMNKAEARASQEGNR
jgi:hypothetical protein